MEDWKIPRWRQDDSVRIARNIIGALLVVFVVIQIFPRRWFVVPRQWKQGPTLDARFIVGPIDPKPINGTRQLHLLQLQEDVVPIYYGLIDRWKVNTKRDEINFLSPIQVTCRVVA